MFLGESLLGQYTCMASLADYDTVAGSPDGQCFPGIYGWSDSCSRNSGYSSRKSTVEESPCVRTSESSGTQVLRVILKSVWDVVKGKECFLHSLEAIKHESTHLEAESSKAKPPPLEAYLELACHI
ncbi:hypothetical protein Bca101_061252 [Brassica carinata]